MNGLVYKAWQWMKVLNVVHSNEKFRLTFWIPLVAVILDERLTELIYKFVNEVDNNNFTALDSRKATDTLSYSYCCFIDYSISIIFHYYVNNYYNFNV